MSENLQEQLGIFVKTNLDYETALTKTIEALKNEGFGVLTEIDVKATMQKKLGVDLLPYKILGACNPPLAYQALTVSPEVGLLLPCNVTIRQTEDDSVEIALIDPLTMLGVVHNPALQPIAEDARTRLERVAQALKA